MPNRLAAEPSPYLRQHAENPVDWYAWGSEALERARAEDRPILLSIGYAACHWCHVMAHESFEDDETARAMNELFVNIKVDREERPDLDGIYMQAVQAMTGQGGWPMTVFLTPQGVPFYGGTYFPKQDRHGLPGFSRVLHAVADAYRNRRNSVEETGARLKEIYDAAQSRAAGGVLSPNVLDRSWRALASAYDERHGGFGGAPKFPPSMSLDFLLRFWRRGGSAEALRMAHQTFIAMTRGGIYDQVGGGLHRYSVDDHWLVPHFEKMLYDNALLVRLGAHLWQATRDPEVRRVVDETLRWLAREMTSPDGGFYSSLDADSEGHEGKFYVWDLEELERTLGSDLEIARLYWGVTRDGNFDGRNILFVPHGASAVAARLGISEPEVQEVIQRAKVALYDVRRRRVWPGLDDKIVASWNGLMLRGVAEAARILGDDEWRELARRNADFLWREMVHEGRVVRVQRKTAAAGAGFLEDHAAVGLAFLDVYALTFEQRWLDRAVTLAESSVRHFFDRERGVFFDTAEDHEALITRPRDFTDNATPAGQSLAAELVLQVAEYTGNEGLRELATQVMGELADALPRHPSAFGHALGVCDALVNGSVEVVLAGDPDDPQAVSLKNAVAEVYLPALILAGGSGSQLEKLAIGAGKRPVGDAPTAYVCRRYTCDAPTHHIGDLKTQLDKAVLPPTSRM